MTPTPQETWYEIIRGDSPLQQGSFLDNFPIITPEYSEEIIDGSPEESLAKMNRANVVIVTQTCDMSTNDDDPPRSPDPKMPIILCLRLPALVAKVENNRTISKTSWGRLIKNRNPNSLLLNKCQLENHELDYQIVSFEQLYSAPFDFVSEFAKKQGERIQLISPYIEHLSKAFARKFARVALPQIINEGFPYTPEQLAEVA